MANLAQRIGQEFKSVRDNEITNLQAADVTLQGNIDTEASTRAAADTALQGNIDVEKGRITTEVSDRSAADTALQSNIDAEASARAAADTTLQSNIDAENARIDAILSASSADKDTFAEIVSFINAVDTTNDTALGTEITTRAAADTTLQNNINTKLDASHDMTLTLSGDVSGSATFTNMANATLSVALGANTVTSSELSGATSLVIYNSAGTALKTLFGAGS